MARAAARGERATNEIAAQFEVHPTQVSQWKRHLFEGTTGLFADGWAAGTASIRIGEVTGNGRADLVSSIPLSFGDHPLSTTYVALSNGEGFDDPVEWGRLGFHDDATRGSGWTTFVGDVNANGLGDLIQINEFGEVWVAYSNGVDSFSTLERKGALGIAHQPDGPWQVFVVPAAAE